MSSPSPSSGGGWLGQLEKAGTSTSENELWDLPASLTDPFSSDAQRLDATLDTFKFSTQPRPLMDWAVIQTGLDDPLSKYTRHELEQAFPRYARNRDQHLKSLLLELKRAGNTRAIHDARKRTRLPGARSAIDKFLRH